MEGNAGHAALIGNPTEDTVATLVWSSVVQLPDLEAPILDLGHMDRLHMKLRDSGCPVVLTTDFDADIYRLPFKDKTFRAVIARDVFERLDGREFPPIIAEICRVARHAVILPMTIPLVLGSSELFCFQAETGAFRTQFGSLFLSKIFCDLGFDLRISENSVLFPGSWIDARRQDAQSSIPNL